METIKEKLEWACRIIDIDSSNFKLEKINSKISKAYLLNKNKRKVVLTIISINRDKPFPKISMECLK